MNHPESKYCKKCTDYDNDGGLSCADPSCSCHQQKCKSSPHCSHNTNGRDMNKPCSIEFHPINREWETRLQELGQQYPCAALTKGCHENDEVNGIVASLLKSEREKATIIDFVTKNKIADEAIDAYRADLYSKIEGMKITDRGDSTEDTIEKYAYNKALDAVLSLIKPK